MRIMGIDFGERMLGIAITDPEKRLAFPLKTVERKSWRGELSRLIAEYQVDKIVLGIPYSLSGRVGFQAEKAFKFMEELKEAFPLPVVCQDERLSTVEAERRLSEVGRKGEPDSLAAAIILQSYLDAGK